MATRIDVEGNVQSLLVLELHQVVVDPGDVIGVSGERGPEHRRHPDRVLIDVWLHVLGPDRVLVVRERHDARLDIEIATELLPHDMHVTAEHEVGTVDRLALCLTAITPLPLQRQRSEHDCLRRSLCARPGRLSGRIEQVGEHANAALLDLGCLGILGVVDEIRVQRSGDQAVGLGLHPGGDEGREVAHRESVEQHLFAEKTESVLGGHAALGQLVVGCRFEPVAVAVLTLQLLNPTAHKIGRGLLPLRVACLLVGRHSHPPPGSYATGGESSATSIGRAGVRRPAQLANLKRVLRVMLVYVASSLPLRAPESER
jgi:hypothetical protein